MVCWPISWCWLHCNVILQQYRNCCSINTATVLQFNLWSVLTASAWTDTSRSQSRSRSQSPQSHITITVTVTVTVTEIFNIAPSNEGKATDQIQPPLTQHLNADPAVFLLISILIRTELSIELNRARSLSWLWYFELRGMTTHHIRNSNSYQSGHIKYIQTHHNRKLYVYVAGFEPTIIRVVRGAEKHTHTRGSEWFKVAFTAWN